MKQFITIFRFEFGSYLKNKIFVGVTLALIILIAGITFFPRVSESLNTGDEDSDESKAVMLIVADEDTDKEAVLAAFSAAFPGYTVNISEEEIGSVRDKIVSGEVACAFELDGYTSFRYYVNNLSMYDANSAVATGVLESLYKYSIMISAGLTPEEANAIMNAPVTGETVNCDGTSYNQRKTGKYDVRKGSGFRTCRPCSNSVGIRFVPPVFQYQ